MEEFSSFHYNIPEFPDFGKVKFWTRKVWHWQPFSVNKKRKSTNPASYEVYYICNFQLSTIIYKLFFLSFFIATHCSAQVNEYTCMAPRNEWKFVLQLRADSTFKYEAFSPYGRWDLLLGKYKVKRNKLLLKPVSSEDREKLALTWGEEQQYASRIKNDTLANGQVMKTEIEKVKIITTIPVSWDISLTRSSYFIIKNNRLYQRHVKNWPVTAPYFARADSSTFDFRKLFR